MNPDIDDSDSLEDVIEDGDVLTYTITDYTIDDKVIPHVDIYLNGKEFTWTRPDMIDQDMDPENIYRFTFVVTQSFRDLLKIIRDDMIDRGIYIEEK